MCFSGSLEKSLQDLVVRTVKACQIDCGAKEREREKETKNVMSVHFMYSRRSFHSKPRLTPPSGSWNFSVR